MKKFLILPFLFLVQIVFGQITDNPEIDRQSDGSTDIIKVELNENYTVVSFSYTEKGSQQTLKMSERGIEMVRMPSQISIDPNSFLKAGGKEFKFIKAMGIPILPNETTLEIGEKIRFKCFYERLEAGMEVFDFIEGKNSQGASRRYWNFYGVHITNPASNKKPNKEKALTVKPVLATKILLKGKVLDAKTNVPIEAKIVCILENSDRKIDSSKTAKTGDYRFEMKPENYVFKISAKGYEDLEESLDLSKVTGKGNFPAKNFELTPIIGIVPNSKEILLPDTTKIEEKPTAIEENKFRLDKVFFNVGNANILPESHAQLNGLLKMMKENSAMTIQVEGHTDNQGDANLNKRLSLDRAFAVREYLIEKGIAGNRVKFKGFGDTKPIASNDTEEGRKQNRRVDFVILIQ